MTPICRRQKPTLELSRAEAKVESVSPLQMTRARATRSRHRAQSEARIGDLVRDAVAR